MNLYVILRIISGLFFFWVESSWTCPAFGSTVSPFLWFNNSIRACALQALFSRFLDFFLWAAGRHCYRPTVWRELGHSIANLATIDNLVNLADLNAETHNSSRLLRREDTAHMLRKPLSVNLIVTHCGNSGIHKGEIFNPSLRRGIGLLAGLRDGLKHLAQHFALGGIVCKQSDSVRESHCAGHFILLRHGVTYFLPFGGWWKAPLAFLYLNYTMSIVGCQYLFWTFFVVRDREMPSYPARYFVLLSLLSLTLFPFRQYYYYMISLARQALFYFSTIPPHFTFVIFLNKLNI